MALGRVGDGGYDLIHRRFIHTRGFIGRLPGENTTISHIMEQCFPGMRRVRFRGSSGTQGKGTIITLPQNSTARMSLESSAFAHPAFVTAWTSLPDDSMRATV
jgi:hypothetical protein